MTELFISTFVTFFVVIDPPGCAPIFASLTGTAADAQRRRMAFKSVALAGAVLLMFGLFGRAFLGALGISLDAFRIAGGIMLFAIAIDMVFETRTQRREERAEGVKASREIEDVSVFPMAIPMIAGPGSIASIMLSMARAEAVAERMVVLGALFAVLAICLIALLAAPPLMRIFGQNVEAMVTRLLGVILAALAAQFVIDGVRGAFL